MSGPSTARTVVARTRLYARELLRLADRIAGVPVNQLAMQKLMINQAYDNMGPLGRVVIGDVAAVIAGRGSSVDDGGVGCLGRVRQRSRRGQRYVVSGAPTAGRLGR